MFPVLNVSPLHVCPSYLLISFFLMCSFPIAILITGLILFPLQDRSFSEETVDTRVPMDILEEEELERISGLLQRDNLVRGLGIVEHVYRLLHCTPGTMGIVKPDPKPQPLPLVGTTVGRAIVNLQLLSNDKCRGL